MTTADRLVRFATTMLSILLFSTTALAGHHPYHLTFAEMEWNEQSQRFEVALQIPGLTIDDELARIHRRRINVETTEGAEELLKKYVSERLLLSDEHHAESRIHWVGMEVEIQSVWAYFEIELVPMKQKAASKAASPEAASGMSAQPEGLQVECRLLETLPGQVNLINVTRAGRLQSLHLTSEQPKARIAFGESSAGSGIPRPVAIPQVE